MMCFAGRSMGGFVRLVGPLAAAASMALGQVTFRTTFGDTSEDRGISACQTVDGGYAVAGNFCIGQWYELDAWLIKTDRLGNTAWSRTYDVGRTDRVECMRQGRDGGYVICGSSDFSGFLIKTNSLGLIEWQRSYSPELADIIQTSDGGYLLVGELIADTRTYLVKINNAGTTLWTREYDPTRSSHRSVKETADSGYIVLETTNEGSLYFYARLFKTDTSGSILWTRSYGGSSDDEGWEIQQTTDGGFVFVGNTTSHGAGGPDVWLVKTDASGNTEWDKTFGGPLGDDGVGVRQTRDGGYIVAGHTESSGNGGLDFWLVKTDVLGNMVWSRTIGGSGTEQVFGHSAVQQTADGGFVVVGSTDSYGAGADDVWLVKTDTSGNSGVSEGTEAGAKIGATWSCVPTPFVSSAVITVSVPHEAQAAVRVYDGAGRLVKVVASGRMPAGEHTRTWDGTNSKGMSVPAGTYFCTLEVDGETTTKQAVIIK